MWGRKGAYKVLLGKPEEKDSLKDLGVNGINYFKLILKMGSEGVY